VGSYEHTDTPSSSVKGREFLDQLSDYQLLKNDTHVVGWLEVLIKNTEA